MEPIQSRTQMINTGHFQIGHVLIRVNNLREAVADYKKMGFNVVYGSDPLKAVNAMIYFEDGSFLELFCVTPNRLLRKIYFGTATLIRFFDKAMGRRYQRYLLKGEGLTDWALDSIPPSHWEKNLHRLREQNVAFSKIYPMNRNNAEGVSVYWSLSAPINPDLPFLMGEYRPFILYPHQHTNGACGIKEIHIGTTNFLRKNQEYRLFFGNDVDDGRFFITQTQTMFLHEHKENKILKIALKGKGENPFRNKSSQNLHGVIFEWDSIQNQ